MKLIEADHVKQSGKNGMIFKYSQIKRQIERGEMVTLYFDCRGELIIKGYFSGIITSE